MKKRTVFSVLMCLFNFCQAATLQEISAEDRAKIDELDTQAQHAKFLHALAQRRARFEADQRKAAQMAFLQPSKKIYDIKKLFDELSQELEKRDSQQRCAIASDLLICVAVVGTVALALECLQYGCESDPFKHVMP
jgi:hypothetical protein